MRNLEPVQINEIVECMYEREFKKDQFVIREGGVGTQLYVISGTHLCVHIHCIILCTCIQMYRKVE